MSDKNLTIFILIALLIFGFGGFYFFRNSAENKVSNIENIMTDFVGEAVQEAYRPDSLNIQKTLNQDEKTVYVADWTADSLSFHASASYNGSDSPDLVVSAHQAGTIGHLEDYANNLLGIFLKTPLKNWRCEKGNLGESCESSWLEGNNKRCVGVINISAANRHILYAFQVPRGSDNYNQEKCLTVW